MNGEVRRLIRLLQKNKIRLALAESVTCGLMASTLCTAKGTSDVFAGAVVCYDAEVKKKLLKVPGKMIRKYSAESKEVTKKLAKNLSQVIHADLYAAVTGLATDDPEAEHPAGTIFFCIYDGKKCHSMEKHFRGSPLIIRKKACSAMFDFITKQVRG